MSTVTLTPAGERIVGAAESLFYERGITAVGVDLIASTSGVTKRTLYNRFGSKDHLVVLYLRRRDERWRTLIEQTIAETADPATKVVAPFAALPTWTGQHPRGCAFLNALAELPDPTHPAHRIAAAQKTWLRDRFGSLAARAGCRSPADLAVQLLLLHEGALATQFLAHAEPALHTGNHATELATTLVHRAQAA